MEATYVSINRWLDKEISVLWVVASGMEGKRWMWEKCFKIRVIGLDGWLELAEEKM